MEVLADRILVYGLGDDGYGCIFFKEDFKQYERADDKDKDSSSKPVAKTCLIANFRKDGIVWKAGGYTTAHDKRRTSCWVTSIQERQGDSGQFDKLGSKHKTCHLLGEVDDDLWLAYS